MSGGGVAVEFTSTKAAQANKIRLGDLQLVDEWVFWSRHVEIALNEEQGSLIFMPWVSQIELLTLARMLHIGRQLAEEKGWGMMKETANLHLEKLTLLGDDSLMINALGLPDELESWEPEEWLSAIRDLPMRDRKTYMQKFGQHVRFLPSGTTEGSEQTIREWRHAYELNGDPQETLSASEAFYKDVMVKLKAYERDLENQRNTQVAESGSSA